MFTLACLSSCWSLRLAHWPTVNGSTVGLCSRRVAIPLCLDFPRLFLGDYSFVGLHTRDMYVWVLESEIQIYANTINCWFDRLALRE